MSARPPRITEWLLARALPAGIVREDVIGSLAEEHEERTAREGRRSADRWYRRQAWGLIVRTLRTRPRDRGRREGFMGRLTGDVRFAVRGMLRAPGPHAVALVTVALGVGVNAAMFSVVEGVVLRPMPWADPDRIVEVWPEKRWSERMFQDVRVATSSFETLAMGLGGSITLLGEGEPEVLGSVSVSADWFETLGVRPTLGRNFADSDEVAADGGVAILGYDLWVRRFGADPSVIGRTVDLNGYGVERRTVVGVLPEDFAPVFGSPQVWLPLISDPEAPGYRGVYGGSALARLGPGVSEARAIDEMRSLIPTLQVDHPTQFRDVRFSPVDVVPIKEVIVQDVRARLWILLGAVGFILLIACTNVANLLLARGTVRRREVGLRLALGADRSRVLKQMITESAVLGGLGGALGVAAAYLVMPVLRSELAQHLPRIPGIRVDWTVVGYAAALSLLAGLLFGLLPGLQAAREDPATVLGDQGRGSSPGRGRVRVNDLLVMAEVALSLVLVVGAGLMVKSLWRLSDVSPGFDATGVLTLNVALPSGRYDDEDERRALFVNVLERLHALPGVERAAAVNGVPLTGGWSGIPYQVQGQDVPEGQSIVGAFRLVSPGYFHALGLPLAEGRTFTDLDSQDSEDVAIVNEAFVARHWPGETGLNRILLDTDGEELGRVVGVVGDTRLSGLSEPPVPSMYFPADQSGWRSTHLVVRTGLEDPATLAPAITRAIHAADPSLPVRAFRPLQEVVEASTGGARFYVRLLGLFAGLALFLGLVGVYGVMSYAVSQRTREIGVRVALGANRTTVLTDTMRRGLGPVLGGIAVGLVGAFATSRFLESQLYEVATTDPWVYAAVASLLALTGAVAIFVPSVRALSIDPVTALRAE